MRTRIIVIVSAAALSGLGLSVLADHTTSADEHVAIPATETVAQPERDEAHSWAMQRLGELTRANQTIGQDIRDRQNNKIGHIKDLAVDLQNGRIVEVIVASGGTLGLDENYVAVPPEDFVSDKKMNGFTFTADPALLKSTVPFNFSDWNTSTANSRIHETYHHFGVEPYFAGIQGVQSSANATAGQRGQVTRYYSFNGENAMPHLGVVLRASRLMGLEAYNPQNQKLGKVDNLVFCLPAGRVVEVILASGGFWGIKGELTAVPPQAFEPTAKLDRLTLDTSVEAFNATPHFTPGEWGYADQSASIAEVYSLYRVQPFFVTAEPDGMMQNVREQEINTSENPTPDNATANQRAAIEQSPKEQIYTTPDQDAAARIRTSIADMNNLSADARNAQVTTLNGTVTLTGTADSLDEKNRIGDAAGKVVSREKVDNQLKVRSGPEAGSPQ